MLKKEDIGENLWNELHKVNPRVTFLLEFYPHDTIDFTSIDSTKWAIGRFSDVCYEWQGKTYEPKILSWGIELTRIMGPEFNSASITFDNVAKGSDAFIRWLEENRIKGKRAVVRLVSENAPDEFLICWWGKADKPGVGDEKQIPAPLFEEGGNMEVEIPWRNHGTACPLDFGKGDCLGNQTVAEKSLQYQQAYQDYVVVNGRQGPAPCGKNWEGCTGVQNTNYHQGHRLVAISGTFTYQKTITKRSWKTLWIKTKKTVTLSDNYSSHEFSNQDAVVPEILGGPVQLELLPTQWADVGTSIWARYSICEGLIDSLTEIKSRTRGFNISGTPVIHLGDYGGVGTQTPSPFFPQSTLNSRLACVDINFSGSVPEREDDAPDVTAVVKGRVLTLPDLDGNFTIQKWSNNPIWNTFFLETSGKYGNLKKEWYDTEDLLKEVTHANELVEDTTQGEVIALPQNEFPHYNPANNNNSQFFRRFHSGSIYTGLRYRLDNGFWNVGIERPIFEFTEPNVLWFDGIQPPVSLPKVNYLRTRYSLHLLLQEKRPLREVINNLIFVTHKGYREMSHKGKIRIRSRKKADNTFTRQTYLGGNRLPVQNVLPWVLNRDGYLIVGVGEGEITEARKVIGVEYSDVGNAITIATEQTGTLTLSAPASFSGGNISTPATAILTIGGTASQFASLTVKIGSGDEQVTISYVASPDDTIESVVFMLQAHLNASIPLKQFMRAEAGAHRSEIRLVCFAGTLILDRALENEHAAGEENLRVVQIYENCNARGHENNVGLDNILAGTFRFNEDKQKDVNTVRANFTNIVDDFALTPLQPRVNWLDKEENGLQPLDVDLRGIGNAWQAGYILKGQAIRAMDCNFFCSWETGLAGTLHEFGDVVAVFAEEGGRLIRYMPMEVQEIFLNPDSKRVKLGAQKYLSAEFDERVEVWSTALPTTLTIGTTTTPPPSGRVGIGIGGNGKSDGGIINRPGGSGNYGVGLEFSSGRAYSPGGEDVV